MTAQPDRVPAASGAGVASAPDTAQELATETLRVVAWILTPEDGYAPVPDPVPDLLRKVACRLLEAHPERNPLLCRHVYEIAAAATAFVLTLRQAPGPGTAPALDPVGLPARLETVPRTTLPEVLLAAARTCRNARVSEPTTSPSTPTP